MCATEMPMYSFAQYARSRSDARKVSAYGVAFLKSEFYAAGGRPVIYGLSSDSPRFIEDTSISRVFDETVLPRREQYRYVAYNPSKVGKWVDWSHEREWRWVVQGEQQDEVWALDYNGQLGPVPALPIFKGRLDSRPFSRVCIIVWTHDEAKTIRELLTGFYLAGWNDYDTPFDKALIEASRIIVLQDVVDLVVTGKDLDAQTIEGLQAANLLKPITLAPAPANAASIVDQAMTKARIAAKAAVEAFLAEYGNVAGYCGKTRAVTYDVTSPIVQYLLKQNKASGPFDGRVVIDYPKDYPPSQALDYNEAGCEAACKVLTLELGVQIYCDSVAD